MTDPTELSESESRLAFALEGADIGVLDWNVVTGEMHFSDQWLRISGYARGELPGRLEALTGLVHPEDLPLAMADIQKVLAGEKARHGVEHRLRHRQGHWIWVQARSVVSARDARGQALRMIGTHRDITERKAAEAALLESTERFQATFQATPVAMAISHAELGHYIDVNPAAEELFGYPREEVIGRPTSSINLWASAEGRAEVIEALRREGRVDSREVRLRHRSGRELTALLSVRQVSTRGVNSLLWVTEDITRRLELEAQLLQSRKIESVGRLAGGIAHDFNNMLGVILGHVSLAMDQVDAAHPLHADLEAIHQAARRSADLTSQLLAFARKQPTAPVPLDLNEKVSSSLRLLRRLLGEDIELRWTPGSSLWPVRMDPSQVDQVLTNLCVNARDAIAGSGELSILTDNVVVEPAGANPEGPPGEYVRLVVQDSGSGMDPETLSHLFEPFFTTKPLGKGTGLGLATTYGIVKQNGGFITVASQPGAGSRFAIHLPRLLGETRLERAPAPAPALPRAGATILVVEDELGLLRLTRRLLEQEGYRVLCAASPGEALQLAAAHPAAIDLLLTDVVMPGMNGRELSERLSSTRPHLRRLFMSGYPADVIAHQGVLPEEVSLLAKPFSGQALSEAVARALARAPPER